MVTFNHDCQHLEDQSRWQEMHFSGHQPRVALCIFSLLLLR